MLKIIHFVQNLSLDITAGAVIMTLFLGKVFEVEVTSSMVIGLAIAIWLIYTIDHLFDAYKLKSEAKNPRHAFHQKYFKVLISFALIVFALGLWNLKFLPEKTLYYGMILAALSGFYLTYSYLNKKAINKEVFAAFVYTAGIATAPISMTTSIDWVQGILLLQIFLLAYANLMIIPLFEFDIDVEDHHSSVVTLKGVLNVRQRILLLCSSTILLFVIQFFLLKSYPFLGLILIMTFIIFIMINRQDLFRKYQLFRILADGIFFLPALYLFL